MRRALVIAWWLASALLAVGQTSPTVARRFGGDVTVEGSLVGAQDIFLDGTNSLREAIARRPDWLDVMRPPYNAVGDGETDDSDAIQAAIDDSGYNWKRLYLNGGKTFAIGKPLAFITTNWLSFQVQGNFATIKVLGPTNAFKIGSKTLFSGLMENLFITYDQIYTSTNAKAVSYVGNPATTPYWNAYNVRHRNVLVQRGYWGFVQENGMSIWGSSWSDCFFEQEMTGGAINLYPSTDFGNVNNVIERCYVRADRMAEPYVFYVKNQNTFAFRDNELNVLTNKAALYLSASTTADIRKNRIEVGKMGLAYGSIWAFANSVDVKLVQNQIQNFEFDPPAGTWAFFVRDYTSTWQDTPSHPVDGIVLKSLTPPSSGGYFGLIAADNQRYELGAWHSDQPASYPYSAMFFSSGTLSNVTAQRVLRGIDLPPKVRGEISFNSSGWPYIAKSFSGTTNDWLKIGEGDVYGPGASSDRSIMVWDGSSGKRAANSLVSIDLDWNLTIPGQALNLGPGYGNPLLNLYGSPNGVRGIRFFSGADMRWEIVTSSSGETTNDNSGTDLEFRAYGRSGTNTAAFLQTVARLRRSDGRLALRQPLEIGGLQIPDPPTIDYWTNALHTDPNGLVSGNPGSILLGLTGTAWVKHTGTGNTGWLALIHTGNDGAGSGLDADLLDGQSGAYYLDRANHSGANNADTLDGLDSSAFLPLTAGMSRRLTGSLVISNETDNPKIIWPWTGYRAPILYSYPETLAFGLSESGSPEDIEETFVTMNDQFLEHSGDLVAGNRVLAGDDFSGRGIELDTASGSLTNAPASGMVKVFLRQSGGKGQFCVRFPSGAVQVIATEP